MKKFFKVSGIIAGILFLLGVVLIGVSIAMGAIGKEVILFDKFDINLGKDDRIEKEYTVIDKFDSIDIEADCQDIEIVAGDEYAIEYITYSKNSDYSIKDGILSFKEKNRNYLFNMNFGWWNNKDCYVKVYVPTDNLDKITLNSDMGNIDCNILVTVDTVTAKASMGNITFSGMKIENLSISCDMGNVDGSSDVKNSLDIECDMGDILIEGYLACDCNVSASMGDVELTTFYDAACYNEDVEVDLGDENFNRNGGKKLDNQKEAYKMELSLDMGNLTLNYEDK